jgi:hypothetical protein
LRYKGIGAFGGVEPSTVESQSTVLPLHYERHERAAVGSLCGGGGSRTPNRGSRGGSLATSCITVLPRLQITHGPDIKPESQICMSEWRIGDSNPWPPACKAGALPTELIPHATVTGLEPASSRSTSGRSRRLSYTAKILSAWLSGEELNLRPPLYQSGALDQLSYRTPAPRAGLEPAPLP